MTAYYISIATVLIGFTIGIWWTELWDRLLLLKVKISMLFCKHDFQHYQPADVYLCNKCGKCGYDNR